MTGRERRAYDVGRLAVLVTAHPLSIFFKESRAELRRFVAVRHATLLDNDLANTYRAYAWWTLAGVVFVAGILSTFIFGRSTPQADAWSLAGLGFLVFTGLLSLLRAGLAGCLMRRATVPAASRCRPGPRGLTINPADLEVPSGLLRFAVRPSNLDAFASALLAVSYAAGSG
jgi:hypothetical protein